MEQKVKIVENYRGPFEAEVKAKNNGTVAWTSEWAPSDLEIDGNKFLLKGSSGAMTKDKDGKAVPKDEPMWIGNNYKNTEHNFMFENYFSCAKNSNQTFMLVHHWGNWRWGGQLSRGLTSGDFNLDMGKTWNDPNSKIKAGW